MSDLDHTEPTPRRSLPAPTPSAQRRGATVPPPIPAAARASRASLPPPLPQQLPRASGTLPPPIPQRATGSLPIPQRATTTLPPPIPQRATASLPIPQRATTTLPPPIPQRARATAAQPVQLAAGSIDFDIDIDIDVAVAPPSIEAPVFARASEAMPTVTPVFAHASAAMPAVAPDYAPLPVVRRAERNAFIAEVSPSTELGHIAFFDESAEAEPDDELGHVAFFDRGDDAAYVEGTEDLERPARSFPFVKLAIAAVVVSGLSAVVTLKVIGSNGVSSTSQSTDNAAHVAMQVEAPPAAPVVEPIAAPPVVEPIAVPPVVETNAAAPSPDPAAQPAVAVTTEPSATATTATSSAAPPSPEPALAAASEPTAAEPVQKPARASKHRSKRARSPVATAQGGGHGQGTLMVSTKPPCEIVIDGVATMLTTPQRSIKLRPGKHKVTLLNDSLKIEAEFPVTIEAGKPTKLLRDLMPK